jgi:hypothetical protein
MTAYHIAQMNVGTALYPMDHPGIADFVARLEDINALADCSAGFVWRLQDDSGNATAIKVSDNPRFIVNMSVWESIDALFAFVYRSGHTKVMARRREWFERPDGPFQVMWWVPAGHIPTVEEGLARLEHLRTHGASEHAFTFKERFPAPDGGGEPVSEIDPDKHCVGWS